SGVFNIAQGQLLLVGAFICFTFSVELGLPFWLALVLTLVASLIMGLVVERLFLRPMIGKSLLAMIIMTLGLASLLRGATLSIWGARTRAYPSYLPTEPLRAGDVVISYEYIFGFLVAIFLIIALIMFFRTKLGLAMRVVSEDQEAAQSMGIRVGMIFGVAWGISAMTAALGGVVMGTIGAVEPSLGEVGLLAFPVIVLGGLESIPGAIIGGLSIGLIEIFAAKFVPLAGFKFVVPYIVLIVVLIIRPHGLFGLKRIERV
ncbi:MAG: branched-chain amino acid ABC transporter permease, partial [Chloroflexi bacterium]